MSRSGRALVYEGFTRARRPGRVVRIAGGGGSVRVSRARRGEPSQGSSETVEWAAGRRFPHLMVFTPVKRSAQIYGEYREACERLVTESREYRFKEPAIHPPYEGWGR